MTSGVRAVAVALLLVPTVLVALAPAASAARVAQMPDLDRALLGATAVNTGDGVYLFGGRTAGNLYLSEIRRYDPATGEVEIVGELPPSSAGPAARQSMAGVWTGTKVYLFGGAVVDPATRVPRSIQDIVEFDPKTRVATNVHAASCVPGACVNGLPEPVFGMGAAWVNGRAWLFGGLKFVVAGANSNITWQDTILRFDPEAPATSDKVQLVAARLPYPVQDMATVVFDDQVYLLGGLAQVEGEDGGTDVKPVGTIVRFHPALREVQVMPESLPRRLHFHAAAVLDGAIWVFGGREARSESGREFAVTSEAIFRWAPGSAVREHPLTLPVPRYAAGVARVGDLVLLLGGRDSGDNPDGMRGVLTFSAARGPPTAPTDVRVLQGVRVNVTWKPPVYDGDAGVDGYRIERLDADGVLRVVGRVGAAARTVTDPDAPGSGTVQYRVLASNAHGDGPAAVVRTTLGPRAPDAPGALTAYAGDAEALVRWSAPPSTGGSEVVEYRVTRTGGDRLFEVLTNATSLRDSNLTNSLEYAYRVEARNDVGWGPPSAPVSVRPLPVPGTPPGVRVESGAAEVSVTWQPVDVAESYEVLRGEDPLALTLLARVVGTSHVDGGVGGGATYWYAVRAANAMGAGIPSDPVRVERLAPPGVPTGLAAIAGHDFVRLQWAPPNETGGVPAAQLLFLVERRAEGDARAVVVANDLRSAAWTDRAVEPGANYTYTVSAVNKEGRGLASAAVVVHVGSAANRPPVAALSAKPSGTDPGENVTLDASFSSDPDGTVAEYLFDFGDGTSSDWVLTPTVVHAYAANGVYTASVRVKDEAGLAGRSPALARVVIGPPPDEDKPGVDGPDGNETDDLPPPPGSEPGRIPGPPLALLLAAAAFAAVRARRRA